MSSNADILLQQKYRSMLDLGSMLCVSTNTIFLGSASISSYMNISGNTTILGSATINSNLNILNNLIINGNITVRNNLYVSNNTIINGNMMINNNLNVSSNTIICNTNINSNLTILGNTIHQGNVTIYSNLNISNNAILNNLLVNNFNVSTPTILNGSAIINNLYVSNNSILYGSSTILSNIVISGLTNLNNCLLNSNLNGTNMISQGNITINSGLYVSNTSQLNNTTIIGSANINNNLNANIVTLNNINISNFIISNLPEYQDNMSAIAAGIPYWSLYRTGGIVKILIDIISPIITLNGNSIIILYIGDLFIDPGVTITDNLNENITPIITGTVNTNIIGTYNLLYTATDSFNNTINITRTVNVYAYPSISNVIFNSNIISFTTTGNFNSMTYKITKSSNIIISETILLSNTINISSLTLTSTPHFIIIYLKRATGDILITNTIGVTNTNFGPRINIIGSNPLLVSLTSTYNVLGNVSAINLPLNTNITLLSSNINIINNLNQSVTIPSTFILPLNYGNIFTITYNVTGTNNVTVSTTIIAQTVDNIPPVITLLGNNPMIILVNTIFVDPGYTITDNSGQTIIPIITGYVNTNFAGTYILTYTATDNSNNSTTINRNIIVSGGLNFAPTFVSPMYMTLSQTTFTQFTFEAWIYGDLSGSNRKLIFGDINVNYGFYLLTGYSSNTDGIVNGTGTPQPQYCLHVGGTNTFSNTTFRSYTWTHVATTKNYNNIVTHYINGIATTFNGPQYYAGNTLIYNVLGAGFIGGKIMNLRIWNIPRTQTQLQMYNQITSIDNIDSVSGLLTWYPLIADTKDLISNTYLTGATMLFTQNNFN